MAERLSPDDYFQWRVPAKIYGNGYPAPQYVAPPPYPTLQVPDKNFMIALVAICFLGTLAYLATRK